LFGFVATCACLGVLAGAQGAARAEPAGAASTTPEPQAAAGAPRKAPRQIAGVPMMERATLIEGETHRVRSPDGYDETLRWYRKQFQGGQSGGQSIVKWKKIVELPTVKAIHVECVSPECPWTGMNIYAHRGETRIFIFPRQAAGKDVSGR
jgi:hypothetical protein